MRRRRWGWRRWLHRSAGARQRRRALRLALPVAVGPASSRGLFRRSPLARSRFPTAHTYAGRAVARFGLAHGHRVGRTARGADGEQEPEPVHETSKVHGPQWSK